MLRLVMLTAVLACGSAYTFAENRDLFQSNHDIRVEPGDKARDVTCLRCSIYVRGEVSGDVTAIGGNVILQDGAQVHGDTTSVFGDIRLEPETSAARDVTAVGGSVRRDPQAAVKGDVTSLEGGGWLMLIVVLPLVIFGGFLALVGWIVFWLVRRNRQRIPVTA
jgi:hypothetical protein